MSAALPMPAAHRAYNGRLLSPVRRAPRLDEYYAAIDLGSNSFHLLIARLDNGRLQPVERFSEKIQLGQHVAETGQLCPAAIERGLKCLDDFSRALFVHPAERIRVVGTQALRVARNRNRFLQAAERILPVPVEVIPGEEEARLIYLGLTCSLPASSQPRLIIDIGGGSTEIAYGRGPNLLFRHSVPVGCVSYRDHWFASGALTAERYRSALEAACDLIAHAVADCPEADEVDYFGASGTIKSIARISEKQGWGPAGYIDRDILERLRDEVLRCGKPSRLRFDGLREHRRSVLVPGLVILEAAMEELAIDHLIYSPAALREGLIFDMAGQRPPT